jgi:hypothetical protein
MPVRPTGVRPSPRRRAARGLAWGLAVFVSLQLGLGLAAEARPRIRDPLYGDKFAKLRRRLEAAERPAAVVMLGSSRTGLAFHGRRVEEQLSTAGGRPVVAFNFGVPASGPVTHLLYLRRMLADGVIPDLLLLEIMPSALADRADAPLEQHWFFADRLTSSERELVIRHGFDAETVHSLWWRSVLLPWYTLRFPLLGRVVPSWLPPQLAATMQWGRGCDECGWGRIHRQDLTADERRQTLAQARAEYAPILADLSPGGPAAAALRELIGLCRDRGVPVRLVLMPEGSEFRGWYPPGALARLDAFLAELRTEFAVPVTDARAWLPDESFGDSHHVLIAGAEAFTDRLTREAIAPALRPAPDR